MFFRLFCWQRVLFFVVVWCVVVFQSIPATAIWESDGIFRITPASSIAGGVQGNGSSGFASVSDGGRFVAFESDATNLVANDTNATTDVFVKDLQSGVVRRASVGTGGVQGNRTSFSASVSGDGRFVAFVSSSTNLVANDTNAFRDVFVKDLQSGVVRRASVGTDGVQGNGISGFASVSGDGRFVAFTSEATNLVANDTNVSTDVFVKDLQFGVVRRVSVDTGGVEGNGSAFSVSVSGDGRFVAFDSDATNLVANDTNASRDVFVKDLQSGVVRKVSSNTGGSQGNGGSATVSLSGDGRFVTFESSSTNLVANDTNAVTDVFVKDLQSGVVRRASSNTGGVEGNGSSSFASVSGDGRFVAFGSDATNLVANDTNAVTDVFVKDLQSGAVRKVSSNTGGVEGNGSSFFASVSGDGRFVAFDSSSTNLVANDTNATRDVFVAGWEKLVGSPEAATPEAATPGVATPGVATPAVENRNLASVFGGVRVLSVVVDTARVRMKARVVCTPVVKKSVCGGRLVVAVSVKKSGLKKQRLVRLLEVARVRGMNGQVVSFSLKKSKSVQGILRRYIGKRVAIQVTTQDSGQRSKPVVANQKVKITSPKR